MFADHARTEAGASIVDAAELYERTAGALARMRPGANSIHGVVVIGAMVVTAAVSASYDYVLGVVAMAFAAMNVVGGYLVTDRMLGMFRSWPARPEPGAEPEPSGQEPVAS
jgi:4TM region of pyridine nucleotide transhydrogenase, mitoch